MHSERKKILQSLIFPSALILLLWVIRIGEMISHLDLGVLGVYPRHAFGLMGILTSPLIHENLKHLFANTIPLFVLGSTLFYFYKEIAFRVFFIIYFLTGLAVWTGAREAYHIGASGVVYGLASFLFFSGIFRKAINLLAISMLVTFLYGSMVWGIFPELFPEQNISWESHFWGLATGLILAFYYRKQGPQRKFYEWEKEEMENDAGNIQDNSGSAQNEVEIKYHIKKDNPE